ncbi:MAG: hypothetical protein L6Q57_06480 [Alphaproteobacteria bacterium]|nr:hypothetical protein [Alphaproteobacteria bacterium]
MKPHNKKDANLAQQYAYIHPAPFQKAMRYDYADCSSRLFFKSWSDFRDLVRKRLSAKQLCFDQKEFPSLVDKDCIDIEILLSRDLSGFWPLLKKFEIFGRLFSHYDSNLQRHRNATLATMDHYIQFGCALVSHHKGDNLQPVSTLLKLMDAICASELEQISESQRDGILSLLAEERRIVHGLDESESEIFSSKSLFDFPQKNISHPLEWAIILSPTVRSQVILQTLLSLGFKPAYAVLLPGDPPSCPGALQEHINFPPVKIILSENILETLCAHNISYSYAPCADVNQLEFIEFLRGKGPDIYLYSGLPGCILRHEILTKSGKRFLHAHGGEAPRYSGSTAFYYSILESGLMGATTFWMDEGLDTGEIVAQVVQKPLYGIDIDYIQDPITRAISFAMALNLLGQNKSNFSKQNHEQRVTYHVIHPILKHIALKRIGLVHGWI